MIIRETHFWYVVPDEVKSVSLLNQYLELLTPCEKENVHRMRGEQLKKSALLARALIRTTIARCRFPCDSVVMFILFNLTVFSYRGQN